MGKSVAEKGGEHGEYVAYIYALPSAVLRVFRLPPAMPCTATDPEPHSRPERTRNTENVSRRGGARRTASLTEGDELMRLTITLTIKKLILQFIVKSRNRHSAK